MKQDDFNQVVHLVITGLGGKGKSGVISLYIFTISGAFLKTFLPMKLIDPLKKKFI